MRRVILLIVIVLAGLLASGWWQARSDPVVRRAAFALPRWPAGARPITVALLSDLHIGNGVTDGARIERIAALVTSQRPDLIVIAGDFIAGHAPRSAAAQGDPLAAALSRLRAPLGVYAALGNHDHWTGAAAVRAALRRGGVRVLENEAVATGPLALGGIGDAMTGNADPGTTARAMAALPGARLAFTHSPDVRISLGDAVPLLLAGHTHCGQIVVPWLFQPKVPSRFGQRYRCGVVREGGRATLITAGTGTSILPFRIGAPPDVWLVTLEP